MMRLDFEDRTFRFWLKDGRSFELSWGLGPIALSIDASHITIGLLLFRVFIPYFGSKHHDEIDVNKYWEYGININSYDLCFHYGWSVGTKDDKYRVFTWPWRDWTHVSSAQGTPSTHPYHYLLKSGVRQDVFATVCEETMRWKLRWLPFIKRSWHGITVKFDSEIGERAGTYKGGTMGCSFTMKKGEDALDALRRMEVTRKF